MGRQSDVVFPQEKKHERNAPGDRDGGTKMARKKCFHITRAFQFSSYSSIEEVWSDRKKTTVLNTLELEWNF